MPALLVLHVLSVLLAAASSEPVPGRVPKVYNALITSNQNLEPSKAYPAYQPVLHDPFALPYQPVFYPGAAFPGLLGPKVPVQLTPPAAGSENVPQAKPVPSDKPEAKPTNDGPANEDSGSAPIPPSTESPIPLNQFGLPPRVLPLGRIDPAYQGFNHISPFTYSYPGFRFYDPYFDPYNNFHPYFSIPPVYPVLRNDLGPDPNSLIPKSVPTTPAATPSSEPPQGPSNPPSEPDNLDVLNYAPKDPSIPNVPPPPLPEGGLKSDDSE